MIDDREWMVDAACRGLDPETWFPEYSDEERQLRKHRRRKLVASAVMAQRICKSCPVKVECATYAIDTDSRYGIWGTTTPHQRAQITGKRPSGTAN